MNPLVSVVIPTYNRPDYLRSTIASALAQTYRNIEVIVQDNASPVDLARWIASFDDPRVRFYRNEKNIGSHANITTAMRRATGKYVAWLFDDDLWHPDFLTQLVPALEGAPDCVIAFADYDLIDGDGKVLADLTESELRFYGNHLIAEGYHREFERIAVVNRSITVFSGSLLRRGPIDWADIPPIFHTTCDVFIAYMASVSGGSCYYRRARLCQIRRHAGTTSSETNASAAAKLRANQYGLAYWGVILDDPRTRYKRYYRMKRARCAAAVAYYSGLTGSWQAMARSTWHAMKERVLGPSLLLYHCAYALRMRRLRGRWRFP